MDVVNNVSEKNIGNKQYFPAFARISVSQECSAVSDEIYNKHIKRLLGFAAGAIDI